MGKPTRRKASTAPPRSSSYRGVTWHAHSKKYECRISIKGSKRFLGYFSDDGEAARVYDEQAALFGKPLNFPLPEGQEQAMEDETTKQADEPAAAEELENSAETTHDEETRKRSKYVGVCWYKKNNRWEAKIWMNGKSNKLGYFLNEAEAARVYDEQAALLGKPVNFPKHNGQQKAVKKREGLFKLPTTTRPSKYVGVNWHKREKKWQSHICFNGKKQTLGLFLNEEEAARVYDKQAALRGKAMNFPQHEGQEQAVKTKSKKKNSYTLPSTKASEKQDDVIIMDDGYDQSSSSSSSSLSSSSSSFSASSASYCTSVAMAFIAQSSIVEGEDLMNRRTGACFTSDAPELADDLCVVCMGK